MKPAAPWRPPCDEHAGPPPGVHPEARRAQGGPLSAEREAQRQQGLLRALRSELLAEVLGGLLRAGPRQARGLAAYRANAGALAERALAAAYPTLQQLLGADSFAGLARAFWHHHPPVAGDIALWGGALAGFVAAAESLADEPCLADVARLEWALHQAATAADVGPPESLACSLELLATHDPAEVRLQLVPGTALLVSAYPVVAIWQAHRGVAGPTEGGDDDARYAAVRAAFAAGRGETALVTRRGWQPVVQALADDEARFTAALLAGRPLAQALQEGGTGFDFEAWLIAALQQQRLAGVCSIDPPAASA